jgi:DNA-binding MarR family transcriptional regulator
MTSVQVSEHSPSAAPARSLRRSTARRASSRRADARSRQSDSEARVICFLADHPGSTVGDLSRHLDLAPEHVAGDLAQLAGNGEIQRASHGFMIRQPTHP